MKAKRTRTKRTSASRAPRKASRKAHPPDQEINTSDIPPLTDDFFRRAVRNPYYRPIKQSTTVRIDADILAWLKSQGPGYQTRINNLLRAAMERSSSKGRAEGVRN
jgi:uncharacterized protein (DUF4415 family)